MIWQAIILLVLAVVLTVVSELLRPKPDIENARPAGLGDFDFPTATEARAIPIAFGTVLIKGPNVIWYGDLAVEAITKKISTGLFSSMKITVGHRYKIGIQFALCHGELDELFEISIGDELVYPLGAQVPLTTRTKDLVIDLPQLFGGRDERGGIAGVFEWYHGTGEDTDANISQYLADQLAGGVLDEMPAYVDVSHVVWLGPSTERLVSKFVAAPTVEFPNGQTVSSFETNGYVGTQQNIEPWAFHVRRFPNGLGLTGGDERILDDANPVACLYELLTTNVWGLGILASDIDVASFQAAGATIATEGNGFSMLWTSQRSARDLAREIIRQIDGTLYQTVDGKYFLQLIRTPTAGEISAALVLDPTNVVELVEFSRSAWNQTFNHIQVNFKDRDDEYKDTSAVEQDQANFLLQGSRDVVASQQYPGVKVPAVAGAIAARELGQLSYPLARCSLVVNREASDLRPGQIAIWNWPERGITGMILRIGSIDLGDVVDGKIKLQAMEDVFGLGFTTFAAAPGTEWLAPQTQPVDAAEQLVFPMPGAIAQQNGGDPLGESRLMSIVPKTQGGATGYRPLWNFGDPATEWGPYGADPEDGEAGGFTPACDLVGDLSAREGGSEVVTSILVDSATTDFVQKILDVVEDQSAAALRAGRNLIMIGSGHTQFSNVELLSFETFTDNGNGTYTLGNVRRGLGDTCPSDHLANSRVYFLDAVGQDPYRLSDHGTIYPGWDGGSESIALDTDTRIQVISPFGVLDPALATQQQVTFENQVDLSSGKAARIYMPLPPFDVVLKMDEDPTPAATVFYVPTSANADEDITWADVSGITALTNVRLEWSNRGRNSSTIHLPGDASDTLDATSEPGEYPISAPLASDTWILRITTTGIGAGGPTVIDQTLTQAANTGFYEFQLPISSSQNSDVIEVTLEARRDEGAREILGRTLYTIRFRRT